MDLINRQKTLLNQENDTVIPLYSEKYGKGFLYKEYNTFFILSNSAELDGAAVKKRQIHKKCNSLFSWYIGENIPHALHSLREYTFSVLTSSSFYEAY